MIYLDNAATTLQKPEPVYQAVMDAMHTIGNCGRGVNDASMSAARTIYGTRELVASFFHCPRADHVVFTQNATEALNIAIYGLFQKGDHVITTALEHNSVLRPLYHLQEQGMELSILPADPNGTPRYELLPSLLKPNTKAIVCTHASNLTGTLVDLSIISAFAKEHGLLFLLDASQTAGARPVYMDQYSIDVLCFTGHKSLMGPQGTGGLCIAPGVEIRSFKTGGTGVQSHLKQQPQQYPTRLEAGTLNGHGIAGLGAALEQLNAIGFSAIMEHERSLMARFYQGVSSIPGITTYGDFSEDRAPIVALNLEGYSSSELGEILSEEYDIAVRTGAHCAPLMHEAIGTTEQGAVRFSFGYYNTMDEVDAAIAALKEIALS